MSEMNMDLIMAAIADLKGDVREVKNHLQTLNGRTRTIEEKVAVHRTLWLMIAAVAAALIPLVLKLLWPPTS